MAHAVEGATVLGGVRMWFSDRDNLDKCWIDLRVDPPHQGVGVGTALAEWAERTAKEEQRTMVLTHVFVPPGERDAHPVRRFAEARGYSVSNVEVVRRLRLPVADDVLARYEAHAAAAYADRYKVSVHLNGVPEVLVQSLCDASNRLGLDAPTGDVDYEPESMGPEDYQHFLEHEASIGRSRLTALAVERDTGVVAAYSDLVLPAGNPAAVLQWGTLVVPEHRGHRLGMAVKVANLRELARLDPGRTTVQTSNAETNPWMVQINKDLGFEVVEEILALRKDV